MTVINNILGPIARGGLTMLSRRRLPQIDGTLNVPDLSAPVEVIRDRWGVPHIFATTIHDLVFAQGFVHAQDRLFQMELNRRTAQGTLSALFGELALDTDRTTRTFGFNRLGRADWENATEDLRQIILAYTDGVNAYINHPKRKLPVEFTLLNHQPEPWKPEDSTAFSRVMIWQLSHAWYSEIIRAQIIQAVGEDRATELEINYPLNNPITLPAGIEFNLLDQNGNLQKIGGPFLERGLGSNAWSVSGTKSDTGEAYLCNDMHLPLGAPGLWYQVHLIAEDLNVTGVSLPGMPLVLVGHNAHIAWGITLAFTDCEDLFIEQFDTQNPGRYRFEDQWVDADVIPEPIQVKAQAEPHIEQVTITRHGPVISDVVGYPDQRIAVNSMSLQPNPALQGWYLLNQATKWDEFVEALRLIEAPQLSIAYADVQGNIGYWVTGKVPVRNQGDGRVPVPGWTGNYEWVGEVPFEEMPHTLNPEQSYVVTCNNRLISDDYPHFLGEVWMNGYRARRIVDIFESKDQLSLDDFRAMQMDFTCQPGLEFIAHFKGLESTDPETSMALERLLDWDGQLTPESVGGTIYEVTRYHLVRNLLEPALGEELTLRLMGQGFHPVLMASHEFYGHDTTVSLRILDNPDSWWLKEAGGKEIILKTSLAQTVQWLHNNLGEKIEDWQWGKIHRAIFPHPLGLQKPLDQVFNRGPYPIGGDTDTPCQTAYQPNDPYDVKGWAPSFRQIVNMGDLSRSLVIAPPGQSGQLGNQHYDDLIAPWLEGDYHPMLWTREQIETYTEGKLILRSDD